MNRVRMILLGTAVCVATACSRDKARQPRAVEDKEHIGLVAVTMSDHHIDTGIIGQAASESEPPKASAAAAVAAPVAVDLSTAEAAAKSYVDLINAGQVAHLAQVVMADQQQAATDLAQAIAPVAEAAAQLHKALAEKFAGHAFVMSIENDAIPADWLKHWTVVGVDVDASDANAATANLKVENGDETATRSLKKVEDKWHVQEGSLPTADAAKSAETVIAQLAEAMKGLAARVTGGELADATAAETEIKTVLANPGGAPAEATAAAATPAANQPAPAATPAKAGNTPKPERSKGELEQQVDDAAGRSIMAPGL